MKRSKAIFDKQGIDCDTFSTDSYTGDKIMWHHWIVPELESFSLWDKLIHEWIGIVVYKMKGYA